MPKTTIALSTNFFSWRVSIHTEPSWSLEHISNYQSGSADSFILKHQNNKHGGEEPVTARTRDCLTRQVREAVLIRRSQVPILNSKSEWHQPGLFRVQQEVERGWSELCDIWPVVAPVQTVLGQTELCFYEHLCVNYFLVPMYNYYSYF